MEKIKPMLARVGTSKDLRERNFIYELKIDGTRCLSYKGGSDIRFLNRRGIWFEHRFPEIISDFSKAVKAKRTVLDGEVYVPDKKGRPSFRKLAERDHLENKLDIEIRSKQMPAIYAVFDILSLNGKDLTNLPLTDRKRILDETVTDSSNIKKVYYTEDGSKLWKAVKKMKLEGLMAKDKSSPYLEGERSDRWLKIKTLQTLDLIILGYTTGTGWRKKIGSIITGCYYKGELTYTGKVGTGLTEKGWTNLYRKLENIKTTTYPFKTEVDLDIPPSRMPVWTRQRYVCEVRFMHLTKDLLMRAPSLLRLREDKEPKDCNLDEAFN